MLANLFLLEHENSEHAAPEGITSLVNLRPSAINAKYKMKGWINFGVGIQFTGRVGGNSHITQSNRETQGVTDHLTRCPRTNGSFWVHAYRLRLEIRE